MYVVVYGAYIYILVYLTNYSSSPNGAMSHVRPLSVGGNVVKLGDRTMGLL